MPGLHSIIPQKNLKQCWPTLNNIIQNRDIFDEKRFAHIMLSDEAMQLVRQNAQGVNRVRLNRMLGANYVGQDALIRFYVLHVFVLPLALVTLLGVHFWRIRKDGGLAKPEDPPGGLAEWGGEKRPVFQPLATKTYGLMALVKGKRPPVNRGPETR